VSALGIAFAELENAVGVTLEPKRKEVRK